MTSRCKQPGGAVAESLNAGRLVCGTGVATLLSAPFFCVAAICGSGVAALKVVRDILLDFYDFLGGTRGVPAQ